MYVSCLVFIVSNKSFRFLSLPFAFGSWIFSVVQCFTALHVQVGLVHILCMSFWLLPSSPPMCINLCRHRVCSRQSKMMLIARSRRKASRCDAMLLFIMTMACFCLQEGIGEGSKHHLSTLQNGDFKSFYRHLSINTIGNVHDASQCDDSDDKPGNCCGLDRQCRNGYNVSSVSFEECQKTDEYCSFANNCFSCVRSPPGKDSSHPRPRPPPRNHKIQPRMKEHPALNFTGLVRTEYMHFSGLIASWHCRWSRSIRTTDRRRRSFFTWDLLRRSVPTDLLRQLEWCGECWQRCLFCSGFQRRCARRAK